jgi:hypothetical protein
MIRISGGTLEECEAIGEKLLANGITPQISQDVVYVAAEDAERAMEILGWQDPLPEFDQPAPFHPCPKCGAPDPYWFGKWKAIVLFTLLAILIGVLIAQPPHFAVVSGASFVLLVIALAKIPEWECGQCHHRWSREPDAQRSTDG